MKITGERGDIGSIKKEICEYQSFLIEINWLKNESPWNDKEKRQFLALNGWMELDDVDKAIDDNINYIKEHIEELKQLLEKRW